MKTKFAIAVVVLQLAILAFMAGEREWVVRTGRVLLLRTAPVDPRDPMRGDYVRFNYEIGDVPRALCRDGVTRWFDADWQQRQALRDRRVFAEVKVGEEGIAQLVALSDRMPEGRLFLRGRVSSVSDQRIRVRYGVEAMFMEQGTARALETSPRLAAGVPLNIEVAVSDGGLAVTKNYRWEPLGIALSFDWREVRDTTPNGPQIRRVLDAITVELKNHGDAPVAIVARPQGGSFRLMADERWNPARFRWVGETTELAAPRAVDVKVLEPGQSHRERLDLNDPKWYLVDANGAKTTPVTWLEVAGMWNAQFRIIYVPPTIEERVNLPHAALIRTSPLQSRMFNAGGGVD